MYVNGDGKMIMVSVIVPVYKVEQYLEKCVNSIREQTYKNIEIILVDDGSPDKSGEICDNFSKEDSRIKVIHKKNGGLSDARNVGIKQASGEYLLFVDSDDWIHKDTVMKTVQSAEKNKADIVLFDFISIEESTGRERRFTMPFPEEKVISVKDIPELICKSCSACNKLFRKKFWEDSGIYFPVGKHYEDLGTIPKLLGIAEKVIYKKEVYYYYLQRTGSIMHETNIQRNYEDRTAMVDNVLEFYNERGLFEKFYRELEYLAFENAYFIPSKEIVMYNRRSPYLRKFYEYVLSKFPKINKNPYINKLGNSDKILYRLLKYKVYGIMVLLSKGRQLIQNLK